MKRHLSDDRQSKVSSLVQSQHDDGNTFEEMLQQLHNAGIYLHPHQLAEFLLAHGLPVHLRYVPVHLRDKAMLVNENYQGDMASLIEETDEPYWDF
ncbi:MAG: hypothetical protein NVS2B14_17060 [Chamaesiphon sp.]